MQDKVIHIITSLSRGGAEAVLTRLIENELSYIHSVIVFKDIDVYGDQLLESGVNVFSLGMEDGVISMNAIFKLYRYLRETKPDIVQTWMFHADLVGGVVSKLLGIKKIFWGVRAASIQTLPFKTRIVVRVCSLLSYIVPTKIICCGVKAKQVMSDNLYSKSKLSIIHNGYDVNYFTDYGVEISSNNLSPEINENDCLIGFVARWDVHKDIPNLLSALKIVVDSGVKIKCLFVGEGLYYHNCELSEAIALSELSSDIILLGCINDMPNFMRKIDICVLSSISEAFPNVLAESMACGTPCVTTDVGDARLIVGKTGWVVPHSNDKLLANAIIEAVSELRDKYKWIQRKKECRNRVVNNFSLDKMVNNYVEIWRS